MGMNIIEKIFARHAGIECVRPGDIVICTIDKIVQHDLPFYTKIMQQLNILKIEDADKQVMIVDHMTPAHNVDAAIAQMKIRDFVNKFGIRRFYDVGYGICHQVIMEEGIAVPGQMMACTDSHTCASGAFNCAAAGVGPMEMLQIICTGKTWYKVSPTIKLVLRNKKPENVFGKDIFLYLADRIGSVENHNFEFAGDALQELSIDDRSTIATNCAELSADFVIFPADELILQYMKNLSGEPFTPVESDPDAVFEKVIEIDLSRIKPYLAKPHSIPNNTVSLQSFTEKVPVNQAFIGSCANGKLEDLHIAAMIVRGKKVARGVRFLVTPASQRILKEASRLGYIQTLVEAGAIITNSTCGACGGGHMGVLGPNEICISSSTRNFKGRMGSPDALIYLGSSATVAASAIAGYIVDPTEYLQGAG